jgi:hypothetical protein
MVTVPILVFVFYDAKSDYPAKIWYFLTKYTATNFTVLEGRMLG